MADEPEELYATTPEHWALMNQVLSYKIKERGLDTSDMAAVLDLIREYWLLLGNEAALAQYVAGERLKDALAQQATVQEADAALAVEIADLQAQLGL